MYFARQKQALAALPSLEVQEIYRPQNETLIILLYEILGYTTIHPLTTVTPNLADLPPPIEHRSCEYCYTKLGRSPPPIETSSGEEWQFQISIVKAHIGRSSGRSTQMRCST